MSLRTGRDETAAIKMMLVGMALLGALMVIGLIAMVFGLIPSDGPDHAPLGRDQARVKAI